MQVRGQQAPPAEVTVLVVPEEVTVVVSAHW